jgi:hypothetical protein
VRPRAHHAEAIDPTLLAWIRHEIDAILGLSPLAMVLLLSALVLVVPVGLALLVLARRRTGGG